MYVPVKKSHNRRIIPVGRDLGKSLAQPLAQSRINIEIQIRFLRALSSHDFKVSKDVDTIMSLCSPLHGLSTFRGQMILPQPSPWPPLNSLQFTSVFLVLGVPDLAAVL